jgi:N6-adenosine-specific RNA methylase IME4
LSIQPGGILQPGAPLYEALKAAFAAMAPGEPPAVPPCHPFANIFPMLAADDRRVSFRASLAEKQNHPVILHKGMLLDGRNRARELIEFNLPISFAVFDGGDRQALDFACAENYERRDLTDKQRAMCAARIATLRVGDNQHTRKPTPIGAPTFDLGEGAQPEPEAAPMRSIGEASAMMHAPRRSVDRAAVIEAKGAPELKAAVETGPISLAAGAEIATLPVEQQQKVLAMSEKEILAEAARIRKLKNDKRRGERVEKLKQISAGNSALPTERKFPVLYMDPPTKFAAGDSDRSTENHYPTMTEEELAKLPIGELATDDAVLFIWTTVPWLRKTMALIEAYGFEYVSELAWDKATLGLGFWNRNCHECVLIATRGKMPAPDPSVLRPSLYREAKGKHSAKPKYFRDLITAYYPDLPKVELFARGELPENWSAWGNQANVPEQQQLGIEPAEEAAA